MAFKPKSQGTFKKTFINQPTPPKKGNNRGRVSLIVDLGEQHYNVQDKETEEWGISEGTKPQMAIFVDLVNHEVDYGGDIGKKQYRLMLNKEFAGEITGTNFSGCFSYDKDGNKLEHKGFTFHNQSLWTKLAKATDQTQIIDGNDPVNNMDIEQLLGQPLNVQLSLSEWEREYEDDDGNEQTQTMTNVKIENYSMVDEELLENMKPLEAEPMIVSFDDATAEQVKILRPAIRKKIAGAANFSGSKIEKVFEELGINEKGYIPRDGDQAPVKKAKPAPTTEDEDFDEDVPF